MASELHRKQKRKGCGVPYLAHLLSVSALVIEHGGDEDQAIAALLHDAVEDQGGLPTLARIREEFGNRVAEMVRDCSDSEGGENKAPWPERKRAYISHIATKSEDALLITVADKIHNVRSIFADYQVLGEKLWGRFTGKRDGTLWYYRELEKAFVARKGSAQIEALVKEFSATVKQLPGD